MATRQPAEQPITLFLRGTGSRNADGNRVKPDATNPPVVSGLFAPGGSTELVDGQETVIDQPTVIIWPPHPDLSALDAVGVAGERYELDGRPQTWEPGTVIKLQRITG